MEITALGMIETSGLLSAIEAADAGLKAADVRLLGTDYVRGGLVMVRFEGDVAAVQAAVRPKKRKRTKSSRRTPHPASLTSPKTSITPRPWTGPLKTAPPPAFP